MLADALTRLSFCATNLAWLFYLCHVSSPPSCLSSSSIQPSTAQSPCSLPLHRDRVQPSQVNRVMKKAFMGRGLPFGKLCRKGQVRAHGRHAFEGGRTCHSRLCHIHPSARLGSRICFLAKRL